MIVSAIEGRLRVVHPVFKRMSEVEKGIKALESTPGIGAVEMNRMTGSLLVRYESAKVSQRSICRRIEQLVRSSENATSPLLASSRARKYIKIGMLTTLGSSLALLLAGSEKRHFQWGGMFVALLSVHLFQNRKRLLR